MTKGRRRSFAAIVQTRFVGGGDLRDSGWKGHRVLVLQLRPDVHPHVVVTPFRRSIGS
jgi:hypothetical protein